MKSRLEQVRSDTDTVLAGRTDLLKPLAGVDRPGIAVFLPSSRGGVLLCDAGANMQPKASHLYQYAVMSSMYCRALGKACFRALDTSSLIIKPHGTA